VGDVAAGQVLVVSADERWLRVLEVTLRLGGVETISRRSAREALSVASGDALVSAIVLDLAQATADELEVARGLLGQSALPAVVILPERLASQGEAFAAAGATVLVRPYRPSELYAALRITDADGSSEAAIAAAEADPTREGEPGTAIAADDAVAPEPEPAAVPPGPGPAAESS
jgi:DNA-binding response OmpR family regulator